MRSLPEMSALGIHQAGSNTLGAKCFCMSAGVVMGGAPSSSTLHTGATMSGQGLCRVSARPINSGFFLGRHQPATPACRAPWKFLSSSQPSSLQ